MRGGRAFVALAVILLAVLGAVLHPVSFVLSILPVDTRQLVAVLIEARVVIFNLLAWGIVALLVVMLVLTVRGRLVRRLRVRDVRSGAGAGTQGEPRIVVAVTAYNDAQATAMLPQVKKWSICDPGSTRPRTTRLPTTMSAWSM